MKASEYFDKTRPVIEGNHCSNCAVKWIKEEEEAKKCFCCGYPNEPMRKFTGNNMYTDLYEDLKKLKNNNNDGSK